MYEITREYLFKENENIFELCLKYLGEVLMLMDNTVIKVDERLTLIKTKQSLRKAGKKRAKGLGTDYDSACVESESTHISTLIQFIYSYLSCKYIYKYIPIYRHKSIHRVMHHNNPPKGPVIHRMHILKYIFPLIHSGIHKPPSPNKDFNNRNRRDNKQT